MKIKKMLSLIIASSILMCGVNASIAIASEGVSDTTSKQSNNIEKNTEEDTICPITGNIIGSGKKNCEHIVNENGFCDKTDNSLRGNKKNCKEKRHLKEKKRANGDELCDVTDNPIKNHTRKCNQK